MPQSLSKVVKGLAAYYRRFYWQRRYGAFSVPDRSVAANRRRAECQVPDCGCIMIRSWEESVRSGMFTRIMPPRTIPIS